MKKRIYDPPCCTLVQVVLEEGLCQSSGADAKVNIKSTDNDMHVLDYKTIGDKDNGGFTDIGF